MSNKLTSHQRDVLLDEINAATKPLVLELQMSAVPPESSSTESATNIDIRF